MKFRISAEEFDALPETMQALYKKAGEGFQLQVDGLPDDSKKVKEFRDNNIKLQKDLEAVQARMEQFKDIDPAKYAEFSAQAEKLKALEEQQLIKAGDLDKVISQRTEAMRVDYDKKHNATLKQLKDKEEAEAKYRNAYKQLKVESSIIGAVSKTGALRPGAEVHIRNMAREVWDIDDDGEVFAKDLYADDGTTPMDPTTWAKKLITDHSYLFESAQGSGAQGGKGGGTSKRTQDGTRVLNNPSPLDIGANLEGIASGKILIQGG